MIVVKRDGSIHKLKTEIPVEKLSSDIVVVVKKPNYRPSYDAAFIHSLSKRNGRKMGSDNAGLESEDFIESILLSNSARVVLVNVNGVFEYVCFTFLDDFENGLTASIHGMIRDCDFMGNKTQKYLKLFQKHKIFDIIIDDYFKSYNNHPQFHLETLEAYLPDFLKEKIVYSKDTHEKSRKNLPTTKILTKAGFIVITSKPKRNSCWKNGRPRDVFIYQIHKKWWNRNKPINYST